MTVDNYLAEAAALAGLAGIMAGFSLAAVVQLLTASGDGRLATAGIVGGIGMAGWMRSRTAGILTTVFALISA